MNAHKTRAHHARNDAASPIRNLRTLCALCVLASAWIWAGCEVSESGGNGSITEVDSTSGADGTSGTSGADGTSGTSGTSGADGTSGGDTSGTCAGQQDPAQSCVDTGCPTGESCQAVDTGGCVPSACACDEATGLWTCTADCGQPMACVPDTACSAAAPPSLSCLDVGCPDGQACVPSGDDACRPSRCECDAVSGDWTCTEDCLPIMECAPAGACDAPNPALSCEDMSCPRGEVCAPTGDASCRPSSCFCDATLGTWSCTDDCLAPVACMVPTGACDGPNPAIDCEDMGCAAGQLCVPSGDDGCTPSSCQCDESTGAWLCTRDCGQPMICEASTCDAYPTTCATVDGLFQCDEGMVCDPQPWDAPPACCSCSADGQWLCTDDCLQVTGCKAAPTPGRCEGENPASSCADMGCPDGQACVSADTDQCVPSACGCDAASGEWICTADCGQAMVCEPDNGRTCEGPNPAIDCADTGCPAGQACVQSPLTVCVPSACTCDEATGGWVCIDDCDAPMVCTSRP